MSKANEFSEGWESLKMISLGETYDTQKTTRINKWNVFHQCVQYGGIQCNTLK